MIDHSSSFSSSSSLQIVLTLLNNDVVSAPPNPQKPANNSEYDLTLIISTAYKVLDMISGPLTHCDAWSATFKHMLDMLDQPCTDCPVHLPSPPSPSTTQYQNSFKSTIISTNTSLPSGKTASWMQP